MHRFSNVLIVHLVTTLWMEWRTIAPSANQEPIRNTTGVKIAPSAHMGALAGMDMNYVCRVTLVTQMKKVQHAYRVRQGKYKAMDNAFLLCHGIKLVCLNLCNYA